jgi:ribosomal-protein-alanine N-acetyltransferase
VDSVLRTARPGDEPALAAIDELVNPSPWSAGQFASACDAGGLERALVAEQGQHIVGFVVYSCVFDEACIHNVAVHPTDQRAGLGGMLLRAALQAARDLGARRCCLEVRVSNAAARGLYDALGFREDGLRKNYYGGAGQPGAGQPGAGLASREDAVLLSLQL